MAHDLFISYSTQDKAIADRLCHELEAKGVRCWMAPRDVAYGADWQQSILDAIASAKALVLVFSAGANTSSTVRKEVLAAVESNVLVIPFRVEDVRPQGALRFNLIDVHWLDAVTPPLDPHIDLLVDRVSRLTEPPADADPEPAPGPAPGSKRRRTRAKADAAEEAAGDAPVEPAPEPRPEPPPPKPVPPSPSPPPPPGPEDDEAKKQQRQNFIIIGAVALAVIVVLLVAYCRPKPDPGPPSLYDSNSSSSSSDSGSSSDSSSSSGPSDISTLTSTDGKNREVIIHNSTGKIMTGLQAMKSGAGMGPNRMSGSLASGQSLKFNLSDGTEECYLWVRGDFTDGSHASVDNFHVCGQSSLTFSETTP